MDGIWEELAAKGDLTAVPHLTYTLNESGSSVRCTADFPVQKKLKVDELNAAHAQWDPVQRDDAEADDGFQYPGWASEWAARGDGTESAGADVYNEAGDLGSKRQRAATVRHASPLHLRVLTCFT